MQNIVDARDKKDILSIVRSLDGMGVFASADRLFSGAVFGRDSLEIAEDIMYIEPELVREILCTLAGLQGIYSDPINEEEPGKIHHEFRSRKINGMEISASSRHIFDALSKKWGNYSGTVRYYGSVDSTPLYVRTVLSYVKLHEPTFLNETVIRYNGTRTTIRDSVISAVRWIISAIETSPHKMVSYQRQNQYGIYNQVWKDSNEFYVHVNGRDANHNAPIASIEVQGLAYDALQLSGDIISDLDFDAHIYAKQLQAQVINLLWMPEQQYFALGLDVDEHGKSRQIKTITANPAALLDSMIFNELPKYEKEEFVLAITRMISGSEFMTSAGIRSRALSHAHVCSHWDYHGSLVTWPKETYDIAKGLRRQGFHRLAQQLENRIINIIRRAGDYPEFIYVDETGKVFYSVPEDGNDVEHHINGTNHPERLQGWTISAVYAIENGVQTIKSGIHWPSALEDELLQTMRYLPKIQDTADFEVHYPLYRYRVGLLDTTSAERFFAH